MGERMTETLAREATALGAALARAYPWFGDAGIELATWADPDGLGVVVSARCGDYEARGRVRPRGPAPFDARLALRWVHRWLRAAFLTPLRRCRTLRLMARQATQSTKLDPRRVFISWSGEPSKAVAIALNEWLPNVIQAVQPWMSQESIQAGSRWANEVARELDSCQTGILCTTNENQHAPWLVFEAGALAKNVGTSHVCPYLIGNMKPSDIVGPLSQFQAKIADSAGTLAVLMMINTGLGVDAVESGRLTAQFEMWWPKLEAKLAALPVPRAAAKRETGEVLAEILETVRTLSASPDMSYAVEDLSARVDRLEGASFGPSIAPHMR